MFQEELQLRPTLKKDEGLSDEEERLFLQQELDQARRELTKFRKEMDGLSAQLNDMASEMVYIKGVTRCRFIYYFGRSTHVRKSAFMQNDWVIKISNIDQHYLSRSYIAEVEQKLAATRDVNANLQSLLDKALTSQKQSSSNTSHLVKNIQIDLARVRFFCFFVLPPMSDLFNLPR